jgi:thymidine phosphorylase
MFRVKHLGIDTMREHVVLVHEDAVRAGELGFNPLDRVRVFGADPASGEERELTGTLNFCRDALIAPDEIGLSDVAFRDLGLPEGASVHATTSTAPPSTRSSATSSVTATRGSSSRCSCWRARSAPSTRPRSSTSRAR